MVDLKGRPDKSDDVDVLRYDVKFLHLLPGKHGPATVFHHEESGIAILVVHACESKGLFLKASNDPDKIGATDYYFYRCDGFENSHPTFKEDVFRCVYWGDYENCDRKPVLTKIPYDLFSIALGGISSQEKLKDFLEKNGHILPVGTKR